MLAILYAIVMYRFSAWRMGKQLDEQSTELADPMLKVLTDRMAEALDLKRIRVHIYEIEPVNGLARARRADLHYAGDSSTNTATAM